MKPVFNPVLAKFIRRATRMARKGPLAEATAAMQRMLHHSTVNPAFPFTHEPAPAPRPKRRAPAAPESSGPGRFTEHTSKSGSRHYKLFIPAGFGGQQLPLVVMLHGCKQDPDDFAAGTRMNDLAQESGFAVLYPAQPKRSNASKCWNWFQPGDQRRGQGEPAALAEMVRHTLETHPIDARRVYVAGLSAGGAMAAILGQEYADLFAASGVHSGLPRGAAHDVASAFAAMQGRHSGPGAGAQDQRSAPTIVFHGDVDATVHPENGHKVIADAVPAASVPEVSQGNSGGRRFTRSVYCNAQGQTVAEHWVVHGAGHAWSGGDPRGSFTDAQGPEASREMLRFFMQHALQ